MRQAYIIAYDVCDKKRLRKVYKIVRGYGDHVQYSVFRCELNKRALIELRTKLRDAIHNGVDQVMVVDIGPASGRANNCITTLGKPVLFLERSALVV